MLSLNGLVKERGDGEVDVGLRLTQVSLSVQLDQRAWLVLFRQLAAGIGTGGHRGTTLPDTSVSDKKDQDQEEHQRGADNDQRQGHCVQGAVIVHAPGSRRKGCVFRSLRFVRAAVLVGGNDVLGTVEMTITGVVLPDAALTGGAAQESWLRLSTVLLVGRHDQGEINYRYRGPGRGLSPTSNGDPDQ